MLKPFARFPKIDQIPETFLIKNNIKAVLLDVDNTLTVDKGVVPFTGFYDYKAQMENMGISLMIVSNGKSDRLKNFAESVKLPYVSMACKPLTFGLKKAAKQLNVKKENILLIGDQLFTDILAGKLYGIKTVLVEPFMVEQSASFKVKRYFERLIKKGW